MDATQMPKLLSTMEEVAGNYYTILFWESFFHSLGSNGSLDQRHSESIAIHHNGVDAFLCNSFSPYEIGYVGLVNLVPALLCILAGITMRMCEGLTRSSDSV